MRTIDIATCCLAGLLAAGCDPDPDPDPQLPDGGAVEDAGPPPPPIGPRSCAEIKAGNPTAANGSHTIYIGVDPPQSVEVYCDDMPTDEPKEYLELPSTGDGANTSVLYLNGTDVMPEHVVLKTHFRRVRLLLAPLAIDLGDTRHATPQHIGPAEMLYTTLSPDHVDSVAFGVSIFCRTPHGNDAVVVANTPAQIDLSGTRFQLDIDGQQAPSSLFRKSAQLGNIDASPFSVTLTPFHATLEHGCNFVAPVDSRWPPVNPTPGSAGTLPLRIIPG